MSFDGSIIKREGDIVFDKSTPYSKYDSGIRVSRCEPFGISIQFGYGKTLTLRGDGRIYYGPESSEFPGFNVYDLEEGQEYVVTRTGRSEVDYSIQYQKLDEFTFDG